ncbi:MAG: ATP-binding protein [Desulfobacterium sp.]|jgi:signal transduction histidine kinase|nr:ATP-binding protein [Desulfobacterium sp.]MDY0374535.1 ATP-binding protein [Desulfobacterium sp.]
MMNRPTTLEDIIGLESTKLGFFGEVKNKIAELQAANLKLEQKQRQLQAILDGISDIMVIISLDFTIISTNRLFSEVFNCASPQGRFCYDFFKNRVSPCPECPIITAQKIDGVCRKLVDHQINSKNHQFEVAVSPMKEPGKETLRFLVLMRDVTREKAYHEQYQYSTKMATVGVLAAGVAHEINNPLTSISGFSEGLRRRLPKLGLCMQEGFKKDELLADFHEYIETIIVECNRCRDIVKSLLTFSPREKIVFVTVDLEGLITDVLTLLRYRLKNFSSLKIELEFKPDLPKVQGSEAELKQVMLNIICNALDALDDANVRDGRIKILAEKENPWVTLSVEDNGSGIAREKLDRIFDPFFTTKPVGKGTGIGLSTCYNVIKQHRGEILVSSQENFGTVFKIKFPNPQFVTEWEPESVPEDLIGYFEYE